MTVTVTNLLQGPADLYVGLFGAAEPATASAAVTSPTPWRDVGGTNGGLKLEVAKEYMELEVDQIAAIPESRLTKWTAKLTTNLAEVTLENLATLENELAAAVQTVSMDKKLELGGDLVGVPVNYYAYLLDGRAPSGKRRRVIIRRGLQVGAVEMANAKDGQTFLPVEVRAHYVSASIKPLYIVDDLT